MKKTIRILLFIIFLIIVTAGIVLKKIIWSDNIKDGLSDYELYIPSGSSYRDVVAMLKKKDILKNYDSFEFLASLMNYKKDRVPPGKYIIKPDMSNRELISMLRAGIQKPVNITFNNIRTVEELAGKLSKYIETDSATIVNLLHDSTYIARMGFNKYNILSLFIPNTYQFYWNTDADALLQRMKKEHDKFWANNQRLAKAGKLGLSPAEVFTLASIVEKETIVEDEKPLIASVYLNRLKKGMLLQADPTVVYAARDFGIKRVLNKHLKIDSPYNTYIHEGLPPGPICMPDRSTIDSVLNTQDTDYLFFCAKPNGHGRHAFAKTHRQHINNANRYRRWLDKNKIK